MTSIPFGYGMLSLNISRLEHFIAVADSGSLSKAAQKVHLSQPAITKSIHKLEDELGVKLFDRVNTLELTPLGRQFLVHARRAVSEVGDVEREMRLLKGIHHGELKIGCGPLMGEGLVGRALARLIAAHPGVKTSVMVGAYDIFTAMLRERRIDFFAADIAGLDRIGDLEIREFPHFEIKWFCRAGHPLAGNPKVSLAEFFATPLVVPDLPSWAAAWCEKHAPFDQRPFRPVLQCSHYPTLKAVVRDGNAVSGSILPALADDLAAGRFVLLNLDAPKLQTHAGLVFLKGRSLSPAAKALIDEIDIELYRLQNMENEFSFSPSASAGM